MKLALSLAFAPLALVALASAQQARPIFADRTQETGLEFTHINGAAGDLRLPEVIGSGGAVFDYDNDGDLDVFAVRGATPRNPPAGAHSPFAGSRLFRNDRGMNGDARVRFSDVTEGSGLVAVGYGMGAAAGDFDNDGWIDLFVTFLGSSRMFRNRGDGTFADVTARTRTDVAAWPTSATFFDYDRDGWLDLFVATYVDFSVNMKRGCFSAGSARDYCNPVVYAPVPDRLFHNEGNGTFSDVSARAGISRAPSRGLGVLAADCNDDGWLDLYVANGAVRHLSRQVQAGDPYPLKQRSQLYRNERNGKFTDVTERAGPALAPLLVSRGVAAGDLDNDGATDLVVFNNSGAARVLINDASPRGHWLGVRAFDNRYRRDALQARVELVGRRGRVQVKRVQTDGSYCVSGDPRVVFGLDQDLSVQTVRVHWGPGDVEEFRGLAADRYWRLERGKPAAAM
jgi:hypothetical protein